jgi:LCP family protein required for cell wall assembly
MQTPNEAPQARHSAFAAAFLSFLLPGLGQMYAGRWRRGAFFMVPWLLAAALIAGTAFSMGFKEFGLQLGLDTTWLQYLLAGITIDLIWRLVALLDAFWVARAPRGVQDPPLRRVGSAVGLLAIVGVLLGSHATIATPTYGQYDALRCATDPDCVAGQPGPTDDPGDAPDESLPPLVSLPPTLPPASLAPGATATLEPSLEPEPTPLAEWDGGRLNVLLIGVNGSLTDTLIVVSIDPDTKQVAFIGIPRDTLGFTVPKSLGKAAQFYGSGGFTARVNQIFGIARGSSLFPGDTPPQRGFNALTAMVGATLGIPIDYYVRVDMGGFRDVVDTMMPSGAIVDVQAPVYDSRYATDDGRGAIKLYIPPGIHSMDGAQALAYSRSRHSTSDFDRSARQMRMITALRGQVDIPSLIGDVGQLQQIIKKDIKTNIKSSAMVKLAGLVQGLDLDKRISLQLIPPVYSTQCAEVPSHPLCQIRGNAPYGYVPKIAAIRKAVDKIFSTDPKTIEQQQTVDSEGATIHVLNGTKGTNERTTNISDRLVQEGLDSTVPPVNAGKADRDDYPDTVITAYDGAADDMPETIKVLQDLFGVTAVTADDPSQTADIVVIVGKSSPNLKPKTGQ